MASTYIVYCINKSYKKDKLKHPKPKQFQLKERIKNEIKTECKNKCKQKELERERERTGRGDPEERETSIAAKSKSNVQTQ